jgi:hypothetical protein
MMPKAAPEKNKGSHLASLQFQHPAGSDLMVVGAVAIAVFCGMATRQLA